MLEFECKTSSSIIPEVLVCGYLLSSGHILSLTNILIDTMCTFISCGGKTILIEHTSVYGRIRNNFPYPL